MFAAQGYIVVAPNYAGYDISTLGYHPFLNADQQSGEMMDILAAARTALPNTFASATSDSGKLFVTGLLGRRLTSPWRRSRDAGGGRGHRRGADVRSLCARGIRRHHFFGDVNLGSTEFAPLLANELSARLRQRHSSTHPRLLLDLPERRDLAAERHADRHALPGGLLPETALFNITTPVVRYRRAASAELTALLGVPPTPALPASPQTPIFDLGFGNPYLINNDSRVAYAEDAAADPDGAVPTTPGVPRAKVEPTFGLRQDFWVNDLRTAGRRSHRLFCAAAIRIPPCTSASTRKPWPPTGAPAGRPRYRARRERRRPGPFAADADGFQESEAALLAYYETAAGGGLSLRRRKKRSSRITTASRAVLRRGCARVLQPVLKGRTMKTTKFSALHLCSPLLSVAGFARRSRTSRPTTCASARTRCSITRARTTSPDLMSPGRQSQGREPRDPLPRLRPSPARQLRGGARARLSAALEDQRRGPATLGSVPYNGQVISSARWISPTLLLEYNFLRDTRPASVPRRRRQLHHVLRSRLDRGRQRGERRPDEALADLLGGPCGDGRIDVPDQRPLGTCTPPMPGRR